MDRQAITIAVIDDDEGVLETVEGTLSRAGFTVHAASGAAQGLELLSAHPKLDLLLTDLYMPKIDGFRLADMVKYLHPEIRILYMTGYDMRARRDPGLWYGPTLLKPFRAPQLIAAVERLCTDSPDAFRDPVLTFAQSQSLLDDLNRRCA